MEIESEPLLYVALLRPSGDWQVLVKRAQSDLTLALDASGAVVSQDADGSTDLPLAAIRWTGTGFELQALAPEGIQASGLLISARDRTELGNGNTFKLSAFVASAHIEHNTPAPENIYEARSIALDRKNALAPRQPTPERPPMARREIGSDFQATPPQADFWGGEDPAPSIPGPAPRKLEQPSFKRSAQSPKEPPNSLADKVSGAKAPRVNIDYDPDGTEQIPEEFEDLLKKEFGARKDAVTTLADDVLTSPKSVAPEGAPPSAKLEIPASRPGHALFRVPRTMWTETAELAEVRLAARDPLSIAMRAAMEQTMTGRGKRTDDHAVDRVGQRMKAQLLGDPRYFQIEPLSSEEQDFGDGDRLGWDWRVVPIREGHSLLTLRMTMTADLQGNPISIDTQALHTSVEITVKSFLTRPTRFVRDNWKWMLGSSGIGAVAAIYALLSR